MHPILFQVGPITIHSYGVMLAAAFLVGSWLVAGDAQRPAQSGGTRRAQPGLLQPHQVYDMLVWLIVGGVGGGRLVYVATNWEVYRASPLEIFAIWHGGLVFYGGFVGGLVAGLWYLRRHRLAVLTNVELFIPYLPLGQAIGRLGCFLNGCCYGRPTDAPWGVTFPLHPGPVHPTQLYEAGALAAICTILWRLSRAPRRPGVLLAAYGLLYGTARFFIEYLRGDNPVIAGGWTLSQWISALLILGSAGWLLQRLVHSPQSAVHSKRKPN